MPDFSVPKFAICRAEMMLYECCENENPESFSQKGGRGVGRRG
jgi:hypothetical protein